MAVPSDLEWCARREEPGRPTTPWANGWSFNDVASQNGVFVKASTLGKGVLTWGGSAFGVYDWTFVTAGAKGTLHGQMTVDLTPPFPHRGQVYGGTGSFAAVTGGFITLDRLPPQLSPPCDGVDNTFGGGFDPNAPEWPGGTPRQPGMTSSMTLNGWLFGDLRYS
jgi:hypothetical protein